MEVNKRQAHTAYGASSTRVYSPTYGTSAYAYAERAAAVPQPVQPERRPEQQQRVQEKRRQKPQLSAGTKAALVFGILLMTCAGLFTIFRYHSIARQYAEVNALHADIENIELRIRELNVALECAVNIEDAKQAAQQSGMTYPAASQYVRVGDTLPAAAGQRQPDPDQDGAGHNGEGTPEDGAGLTRGE